MGANVLPSNTRPFWLVLQPRISKLENNTSEHGVWRQTCHKISVFQMTSAADPGKEPGGPTPPYFLTKLRPEVPKKIFWARFPPPPPTPALSQSLADRRPRLFKGLGPPLDLAYKGLRTCIWIRFFEWEIQYWDLRMQNNAELNLNFPSVKWTKKTYMWCIPLCFGVK